MREKIERVNNGYIYLLNVMIFEQNGKYHVYSPVLDIVGTGKDKEQAYNRFYESLGIYFDFVTERKTLLQDLTARGWETENGREFFAPSYDINEVIESHEIDKYEAEMLQHAV